MNFRRVKALSVKEWKKIIREPATLFLIVIFPVVMTFTFNMAFGGAGIGGDSSYNIGMVNLNEGGTSEKWTEYFIGNLTVTEILILTNFDDNDTAQISLRQGKLSAVIVIPPNFDESLESYFSSYSGGVFNTTLWINTTLEVDLDAGSMFATQVISPLIQQALISTIYGEQQSISIPITIDDGSKVEVDTTNQFDIMAPGLFAFSVMFLTMIIAVSIVDEREKGLLKRMSTTPLKSSEFMTSHLIANIVVAAVQVALVFIMAGLTGYNPGVGPDVYAMSFLIIMVYAIFSVGAGLITASVSKNVGAATGLSFIFILPQMMLGTFIPVGDIGRIMPSYYVTDALSSLLLRGAQVFDPVILFDLLIISLFSSVVFAIGVFLNKKYSKK